MAWHDPAMSRWPSRHNDYVPNFQIPEQFSNNTSRYDRPRTGSPPDGFPVGQQLKWIEEEISKVKGDLKARLDILTLKVDEVSSKPVDAIGENNNRDNLNEARFQRLEKAVDAHDKLIAITEELNRLKVQERKDELALESSRYADLSRRLSDLEARNAALTDALNQRPAIDQNSISSLEAKMEQIRMETESRFSRMEEMLNNLVAESKVREQQQQHEREDTYQRLVSLEEALDAKLGEFHGCLETMTESVDANGSSILKMREDVQDLKTEHLQLSRQHVMSNNRDSLWQELQDEVRSLKRRQIDMLRLINGEEEEQEFLRYLTLGSGHAKI